MLFPLIKKVNKIVSKIFFEMRGYRLKKIAVAIIHGIGTQTDDFAIEMEEKLKKEFTKRLKRINPSSSARLKSEPNNESKFIRNNSLNFFIILEKYIFLFSLPSQKAII